MITLDLATWAADSVGGSMGLALPVALLAGLVSFFSPCVVPLLPGYLSYATGLGAAEVVEGRGHRGRMLAGASLFVLGFAVVFVITGVVAGTAGRLLAEYHVIISRVLGIVVIILGLIFAGVLRIGQRDLRLHRVPAVGVAAAPLLGVVFALGWTPCLSPTLGVVVNLGFTEGTALRGGLLGFVYALGLGIPFVIAGLAFTRMARAVTFLRRRQQLIMRVGGVLLVVVGLLLVTGAWDSLTGSLRQWGRLLPDGDVMTQVDDRPVAAAGGERPDLPRLGPRGAVRFLWAQLTSMRTALVLLFALALAAIPGSLVPQRKVAPVRVSDFLAEHQTLGPIYDKIGMFNVYSSPWFSAIYLLLFISLVGCIVPRIGVYARGLRAQPPRTPRNLSRLPAYATAELSTASPGGTDLLDQAEVALKKQRYRVARHGESLSAGGGAGSSIAAERGYLREAGNLIFHVSLLFVLLGAGINGLWGFRGSSVVIVGQGFSNNLTQYDDISAGAEFSDTDLKPFSVVLKSFDVKFETGDVQRGAAREFKANVSVTDRPGATPHDETIEVNHPLNINGTTVHLIGHGYAPVVTVKDGNGNIAFSGPVVMLPQDGNFTSIAAIKVPDARPERLAFEAFFYPTAVLDPTTGPTSVFPDALNPALFMNAWAGPPKVETGEPENVYSLDPTGLTQLRDPKTGQPERYALNVGDGVTLPDGKGSIQFDGWTRWVKLQVGDSPGIPIAIGAVGFAVAGLCLSLFIRPRRIWVRLRGEEGATTRVVEVGGLDRADARAGLTEDVAELADQLAGRETRTE